MYFAYSFPYGYGEMRKYVDRLIEFAPKLVKKSILCRTTLNHNVYML